MASNVPLFRTAGNRHMAADTFGIHGGLLTATRVPFVRPLGERISRAEVITLLCAGAAAAAMTGLIRLGLRLPGNSIVFAVLPIALGFALVPRRRAGVIMAGGAFSTAGVLSMTGLAHYGTGAMTSLCLIGPLMDLALAGAGSGWRLYVGLVAAGVAGNLAAFLQRGASKVLLLDGAGTRPFATWWPQASVTYTVCGAAAGLLAAMLWFKLRRNSPPPYGHPDP